MDATYKAISERYPDNLLWVVKNQNDSFDWWKIAEQIIIYNTVDTTKETWNESEATLRWMANVLIDQEMGHFEGELLFCEDDWFQIKLHGHRIELEDIDNNLLKNPKFVKRLPCLLLLQMVKGVYYVVCSL